MRSMPKYEIEFAVSAPDTLDYPHHLLRTGHYTIETDPHRGVSVVGTRDGLLYLAEVLVRCALSDFDPSFHVHLPLDSRDAGPNLDARPELTVFGAQSPGSE